MLTPITNNCKPGDYRPISIAKNSESVFFYPKGRLNLAASREHIVGVENRIIRVMRAPVRISDIQRPLFRISILSGQKGESCTVCRWDSLRRV